MSIRISQIIGVCLVGVSLAVIACAGPGNQAGAVAKTTGSTASGSVAGTAAKAPGTFTLNGESDGSTGKVAMQTLDIMRFAPNNVTKVKPNAKIELELTNTGATVHSVFAPGMGLATAVRVNPLQKGTATLTAPSAPGTYQFWCNEPGHAEAGMIGQIVVSG